MATRTAGGSLLQLHLPENWPSLAEHGEPLFRWARYDRSRKSRGASPLREVPSADHVIAVAPATRVLVVRVQLPQ